MQQKQIDEIKYLSRKLNTTLVSFDCELILYNPISKSNHSNSSGVKGDNLSLKDIDCFRKGNTFVYKLLLGNTCNTLSFQLDRDTRVNEY